MHDRVFPEKRSFTTLEVLVTCPSQKGRRTDCFDVHYLNTNAYGFAFWVPFSEPLQQPPHMLAGLAAHAPFNDEGPGLTLKKVQSLPLDHLTR